MATKSETEKDGTTSGSHLTHKAEEYVKNPTKISEFTKEREAKEKEAKEKAESKKGQTGGPAPAPAK
jgi:hypothetical protein